MTLVAGLAEGTTDGDGGHMIIAGGATNLQQMGQKQVVLFRFLQGLPVLNLVATSAYQQAQPKRTRVVICL